MKANLPKLALSLLGMVAALAGPAVAQQFVHLDARVHGPSTPVSVPLAAGCWKMTPVGVGSGGQFTAWHAWGGRNVGCQGTGGGCTQGWATLFLAMSATMGHRTGGAGFFSTQAQAFASSGSSTLWLPRAETIRFAVPDNNLADNLGGVSVRLDPIAGCANPAALVSYGAGTSGVAGVPSLGGSDLPMLGNASFELQLDSAAPSTAVLWMIGFGRGNVSLPDWGAVLLVQPVALTLGGTTDAAGTAALPLPLDCDATWLCGVRFTAQAAVLDAAATGGIAFSAGVDLTLGS